MPKRSSHSQSLWPVQPYAGTTVQNALRDMSHKDSSGQLQQLCLVSSCIPVAPIYYIRLLCVWLSLLCSCTSCMLLHLPVCLSINFITMLSGYMPRYYLVSDTYLQLCSWSNSVSSCCREVDWLFKQRSVSHTTTTTTTTTTADQRVSTSVSMLGGACIHTGGNSLHKNFSSVSS